MEKHSRILIWLLAATTAGWLRAQQIVVPDTAINPLAGNPAAAEDGHRLFSVTCQICHGADGQGDRDRGGAVLNRAGLKHGDKDADILRLIRNGVPGTQMPPFPGLSEQQAWQLVTFIHSLQGHAAVGAGAPVPGDRTAGEALFFGRAKCSTCHEINARGGIVGPDLSDAGRLGPAELRQKILAPNTPAPKAPPGLHFQGGGGAPPPLTVVVRTQDGQEIRGVRRNEDMYSVQLVDAAGQLHLIDKQKVASVTVEDHSLMPDDYSTRQSGDDVTNLVAYLCAQDGRDYSQTILQPLAGGLDYERIVKSEAEPQNWLTYWGDYRDPLLAAQPDQSCERASAPPCLDVSDPRGRFATGEHAFGRRRRPLHHRGRKSRHRLRPRRPNRPANLVLDPPAKGGQPLPDQPLQPRGSPTGEPSFCRHAGRRLDRP